MEFWRNVDMKSDDECWPWKRSLNGKGYGLLQFDPMRTTQKAHRVSYLLTFGAIPERKHVLHRCDNPSCCNPYHLYVGTNSDNAHDRMTRGRQQRGEATARAKLTPKMVREIREEYIEKQTSCERLADRYPCNASSIWLVLTYKSWPHVAPELRDKIVMRPKVRRGEDAPRSRLTSTQVTEARLRHAQGETIGTLRRDYGVSWTNMRRLLDGRTWSHIPMPREVQQ